MQGLCARAPDITWSWLPLRRPPSRGSFSSHARPQAIEPVCCTVSSSSAVQTGDRGAHGRLAVRLICALASISPCQFSRKMQSAASARRIGTAASKKKRGEAGSNSRRHEAEKQVAEVRLGRSEALSKTTISEAHPDALNEEELEELARLKEQIRQRKAALKEQGLAPSEVNNDQKVLDLLARLHTLKDKEALATKQANVEAGDPCETETESTGQSSMDWDAVREELHAELEATTKLLREDCGYSDEEMEADHHVVTLKSILYDLGGKLGQSDRVQAWDLPYNTRTEKEGLKAWYHRKYLRRHGILGSHWDNRMEGKSVREKKQMTKEFIEEKRRLLSVLRKKSQAAASSPGTPFDDPLA